LAVASAMDDAVARIEDSFKTAGMWTDTILVFSSDNGGGTRGSPKTTGTPLGDQWPGGSSFPLRGRKSTDWEGGIRVPAFVRGTAEWPIVAGDVTHEMIHISDWFPTLAHVAGAALDPNTQLDGHNIWDVLANGASATRTSIIFDCPWKDADESASEAAVKPMRAGVIRKGALKFMYASNSKFSTTNKEVQQRQLNFTDDSLMCSCPDPISGKYLFDIVSDPSECHNLAGDVGYADAIADMESELETCSQISVPGLSYRFFFEGKKYWMDTMKHTKVFDDDLKMMVWKEWDCGEKYPGECGWPMR